MPETLTHEPPSTRVPDAEGAGLSAAASRSAEALRSSLARRRIELPLLPEVPNKVREAAARDGGDARALSELIRRDAAFAGHLLRVANSPAYAGRTPIGSLQQAVSRLGVRTIGEIALVVACRTRAFAVKGREAEVRALFCHSLATALHAREIARMQRLEVEDAFLGGLLHDIGKPMLIQALMDQEAANDADLPPLSRADFDAVVLALHEEVGAEIIVAWNLPARLADAVRHHHHPELAGASEPAAALLAFANELAHLKVPVPEAAELALRNHASAAALNLYAEDVDTLIARGPEVVVQVQALL